MHYFIGVITPSKIPQISGGGYFWQIPTLVAVVRLSADLNTYSKNVRAEQETDI